ncbi:AsmA-like C-terminal region-containing protein [Prolixibacteraceae bacterium]|nr:AsmA-like C-terminal region-containing protein [Prolixibacteraceae bacterium]
MKKALKVGGIIVGVIILVMLIVPFFFKDRIKKEVIVLVENNVDAKLYTEEFSLSLFKSFPHLNVSIEDFKLVHNDTKNFTQPIVALKRLELDVNVSSLWKDKSLNILKFELVEPNVALEVTKEGKPNWDIVKNSEEVTTTTTDETTSDGGSSFGVNMESVIMDQATVSYIDRSSNIQFVMNNFNLQLNGKMTGANTALSLETNSNITCLYEDVAYLSHVPVSLLTTVKANFDEMLFEIVKSDMTIQSFPLVAQGTFQMDGNNYVPNIKVSCPTSSFAELLGLVPNAYKSYLDGLEMIGKLAFSSHIEGVYNESTFPKVEVKFEVKDGHIKYKDLPESVENIDVRVHVSKPQGGLDLTKVDVPMVSMVIGKQPIKASFSVTQPMSNPNFVASLVGNINLSTLKNSVPVKTEVLEGNISANMKLQGTMDLIDKEAYDQLYMSGELRVNGVKYKDSTLRYPIEIPKAGMDMSAKKITLQETQLKVKSDIISFTGYIQNYFPYIFKDKTLSGHMSVMSKHIDAKTWMNIMVSEKPEQIATVADKKAVKEEVKKTVSQDTVVVDAVQIPKGLEFDGFLNIASLKYDDIIVSDIVGNAKISNQKAILSNLSMRLWNGALVSSGSFNTQNAEEPSFDFSFKADKIQITEAYRASKTIQKYAPIAKESSGDISADMKINGTLAKDFSPKFKTFNGKGVLSSSEINLKADKSTKEIAKLIQGEGSSDHLKVSEFSANFDLENGNLRIHPVNTKVAGQKVLFYGTQNLEGEMNYQCDFLIAREKLSKDVKSVVDIIPGASTIKEYNIGMRITGTTNDPKVKVDLSKAKKQIQQELEKKAGNKVKGEIGNLLKGLF